MAEAKKIDLGLCGGQHGRIDEIKAVYVRMLAPLKERLGKVENGITCVPLMKGKHFTGNTYLGRPLRILFVGRAVNGWEIDFRQDEVETMVEQIFDSAIDTADIGKGMVCDNSGKPIYDYRRSPFFQLCHAVMGRFGFGEDWSEHLAWTNLYKAAPYKAGNPDNELIRQTLPSCAEILRKEISYLRPTHIVFITGDWWYKPTGRGLNGSAFIDRIGVDLNEDTSGVIIGRGISQAFHFQPNIVITKRPEGAKLSRAEHAGAIFDAFVENERNRPKRDAEG